MWLISYSFHYTHQKHFLVSLSVLQKLDVRAAYGIAPCGYMMFYLIIFLLFSTTSTLNFGHVSYCFLWIRVSCLTEFRLLPTTTYSRRIHKTRCGAEKQCICTLSHTTQRKWEKNYATLWSENHGSQVV